MTDEDVQGPAHDRLTLATLGVASLSYRSAGNGLTTVLPPGKPLALITYLACSPARSARREHLIDLLWADLEPAAAHHALRQATWYMRQRLGEDGVVTRGADLALNVDLTCDRNEFLQAVEQRQLERAVGLYRGDFFPAFAAPGGAGFEQWSDIERRRLRLIFLRAAEALARQWLSQGRFREARDVARRVRDVDPASESGWRLLIESHLSAGDALHAALEADALEEMLAADDRVPEPATVEMLQLARRPPADQEPGPRSATLVAELVGREREFAAILAGWEATKHGSGRHLHVTAAAGLGKTRLLQDAHHRLRATGARTILLRANPGARHLPYALASDLAQALAALPGAAGVSSGAAGSLVALNPILSSRYPAARDTSSGDEALRRRATALCELLATVADEQPIALLVDDLHWCDPASRQMLAEVAAKVGKARLLLVTTARPTADGGLDTSETERITLEPLSPHDLGALVGSLGTLPRASWADELPPRLHAATDGSPLLVLESLALLLERGTLGLADGAWTCPDSEAFTRTLAEGSALKLRIQQLDPAERRLLVVVSVAQSPVSLPMLAEAIGQSEQHLESAVTPLEQRGFLARGADGWGPAHDEIARRALDLTDAAEIRSAHAGLGAALASGAADDLGLLHRAGRHLAAAGEADRLRGVYRRWLLVRRARGSRESLRELATDLLGDLATPERVRRLVASLPIGLRLGLTTARRRAAAAGIVLLAAIGASAVALARRAPPAPDALLLTFFPRGSDSSVLYTLPLYREWWQQVGVLDPIAQRRKAPRVVPFDVSRSAVPSPDGRWLVFVRVVPDSGEQELFLLREDGREARLTYSPGDDIAPSWSPDGRYLVFQTVRWTPRHHYDLAVLDLATGAVRALTQGDDSDYSPRWSPDGTRIAFEREYWALRPPEICWISVEGTTIRCLLIPGGPVAAIHAWADEQRVLATVTAGGSSALVRADLETGAAVTLDSAVGQGWSVSPDGRWAAVPRGPPGQGPPHWYVFPVDRPDLRKQLRAGGESLRITHLTWGIPTPPTGFLDRVQITTPATEIPLDALHHLEFEGVDTDGDPVVLPPLVTWRSGDTLVATVDSTGTVHPRSLGTVTIYASAGGWREDSVRAAIRPSGSVMLFTERWAGPLQEEWVPFGVPAPSLTSGVEGVPALWHRGDSTYHSGVYSRRALSAARGLGTEAQVSTPITMLQWQSLNLSLTPALDSARLGRWDHRSGGLPLPEPGADACGITYPAGDGLTHRDRMRASGGPAPVGVVSVDSSLRSGRSYRVRLQIFPDGRCGIAVNGHATFLSGGSLRLDRPYRVLIEGKSVGTRILVGPLDVWEGVRADVDWATVDGRR